MVSFKKQFEVNFLYFYLHLILDDNGSWLTEFSSGFRVFYTCNCVVAMIMKGKKTKQKKT